MTSLQGKPLLVTGASSGTGQAPCDLLADRGANVQAGAILMRGAGQQT